jgi:hypothetical protein
MLGRPPVLKLANRIESYVDINQKVVLNKHGKTSIGLTTVKTVVPTGSATPSEDPLELEITEPDTAAKHEVSGIMV